MKRSDVLDAVRGVAAVSVLLFHTGYLPIGWIGVPVFFTLSGYLITRQLSGGMDPVTFWRRRAVRILPLLFAYLTINAVLCLVQGRDLSTYAGHYLLLSDLMIARGMVDTHGHIGHLWSIAVEMQVYAIWPTLLLIPQSRRALATIMVATVGFIAWFNLATPLTTLGCIGFFAVGGLAALLKLEPPNIAVSAALVVIGRAGYSIYLWQMMCVGLAFRTGVPALAIPLTIAVGLLSYRIFEKGWRHHAGISPSARKRVSSEVNAA